MASTQPKRPGYFQLLILGTLIATLATVFYPNIEPVKAQSTCGGSFISVSPALTDLGAGEYVRLTDGPTGHIGGLYPGGTNTRSIGLEADALARAGEITPLNTLGDPDLGNGTIAMISVGMSNTQAEFATFIQQVNGATNINPQLKIINGALSGMASDSWVSPTAPTWDYVDGQLANQGLTPAQVQVAWLKQAQTGNGDFPAKAEALQADLEAIARNLYTRYPNIKITYLSSRTRSYTYWNGLSPEPVAFETGFAVRWLIEKQLSGDLTLNNDPGNGPVVAPLLVWGPYIWADGSNPRGDGFVWLPDDMAPDCTHPSSNGRLKIANLLLEFFQSDTSTTSWFLGDPGLTPTPQPTVTATVTPTPYPNLTPQAYLPVVPDNYQYMSSLAQPDPIASSNWVTEASVIKDLQITGASTLLLILLGLGFSVWWGQRR